jgi:hypothetical protein
MLGLDSSQTSVLTNDSDENGTEPMLRVRIHRQSSRTPAVADPVDVQEV